MTVGDSLFFDQLLELYPLRTVADPDLQVSEGGGGVGGLTHLDPEIRGVGGLGGGLKKIVFWPFRPQFGLKIRGGGAFPGSASEAANRLHRLLDFFLAVCYCLCLALIFLRWF